jgi:hypothetical protein
MKKYSSLLQLTKHFFSLLLLSVFLTSCIVQKNTGNDDGIYEDFTKKESMETSKTKEEVAENNTKANKFEKYFQRKSDKLDSTNNQDNIFTDVD